MKILLRRYDDEFYVWKDAIYKDREFLVKDDTIDDYISVDQINILAIKDDDRANHVICSYCGAVIKNDPESIEAHYAEKEASRDCFKCSNLRIGKFETESANYTKNENGTYSVEEKYSATLKCGIIYYSRPNIDAPEALQYCKFYQCRRHGTTQVSDIFTNYPDPFDKFITIDALVGKYEYERYRYGHFEYDLKCRNSVKACVNEVGIVDHFIICFRNRSYVAYYSAKYDKLFFCHNGRDYEEGIPGAMSEARYNQAKAKISALYKEGANK